MTVRLMSFALTEAAFVARRKTVTRRLGWVFLKAGDELMGVRKAMGRMRGEPVVRLGQIRVVSVRRERLDAIDAEDVVLEGFNGITPYVFVALFCKHMRCTPSTVVTRIEFEHV